MFKYLAVIISFLISTASFAQKGFSPVTDTAAFRIKFQKSAAQLSTVKSDFIQEKNLSLLTEKISSKGKFLFKKENKVRMEYTEPFQYLLVINQKNIMIREGGKTTTFSSKSNKLFEQISRIVVDCVQGTVFSNPDFKISVSENSKLFLISMKPVDKSLGEFFSMIKILINKSDHSVASLDMLEVSGDNTLITLTNSEMNIEIPDEIFPVK